MDALGGRGAKLSCVWRQGAGERRRWEEAAINTQGVCASLSRTIKWKRYQCSNNGFVRYASYTFPLRVFAKAHPRWVRHFQGKPCKLCWIHGAAAESSRKADSQGANRRDQQGLLVMKRTAPFCTVLLPANKCYIASEPTRIRAVD